MKAFKLIAPLLALIITACGGKSRQSTVEGGDTLTHEAGLLTLIDHGAWTSATVVNPWDTTKVLARYALMREEVDVPQGYVPVKVPIQSAAVFAGVYGNALIDLGAEKVIKAVADAGYATGGLQEMIAMGQVRDVGPAMSPSVEALAEISPVVMLMSPYHNAGHGEESRLGIPIIEMADYMENRPLGRAEWLLLLGELTDRRTQAQALYKAVADNYRALADSVSATASRPVVLTEKAYSGVWNVPGGDSYAAHMIWDAGGKLPWQEDTERGSLVWDYEKVLNEGQNADIWLLRVFGPLSLEALRQESPIYTHFRPYREGRVYSADTRHSPIFDDVAFHPDRVLAEYIRLLHPEALADTTLRYFKPTPAK